VITAQQVEEARARVTREARRHFEGRSVSRNVIDGYVHRQTLRALGLPVTKFKGGTSSQTHTQTLESFLEAMSGQRS